MTVNPNVVILSRNLYTPSCQPQWGRSHGQSRPQGIGLTGMIIRRSEDLRCAVAIFGNSVSEGPNNNDIHLHTVAPPLCLVAVKTTNYFCAIQFRPLATPLP